MSILSRSFGRAAALIPHLLTHGLSKEIADVRADVEAAFLSLESDVYQTITTTLTQATWFIDPQNVSGKAKDTNTGLTALTPLLTHAELSRRRKSVANAVHYGGRFPILQDTTVTYLSAPSNPYADPITLNVSRTASYTLSYVGPAPTTTRAAATISAIPNARGTTHYWQVTGGFSAGEIAKLVTNTTKGTSAFVLGQSAGVADTSEWITTAASGQKTFVAMPIVNPAVSDVFDVKALGRFHLGDAVIYQSAALNATTLRIAGVTFYRMQWACDTADAFGFGDQVSITGNNNGNLFNFSSVAFTECIFEGAVNLQNMFAEFWNCYASSISMLSSGGMIFGGYVGSLSGSASVINIDGYMVIGGLIVEGVAPTKYNVGTLTCYVSAGDVFNLQRTSSVVVMATVFGGVEIVGNANRYLFRISNGAKVTNPNNVSWVAMIKCNYTSLILDGQTKALGFSPTTLLTDVTARVVTPAALDAVLADGAGFGGWAVVPGTGTAIMVSQT